MRVLPFGVLKEWLGSAAATVELPTGATVAELLQLLGQDRFQGRAAERLRGIAVSVNAEFAPATHILSEGDEVGLLPPVSGGCRDTPLAADVFENEPVFIALIREPIDAAKLMAAARCGEDGAVVVFDGVVRDNTRDRATLYLDYEAYEEMAERQMREMAAEAIGRFNVRQVTLAHRLGRLQIGETSVLIVVSSAHRAAAFEACRWLIDTLKQTVPIWKRETFADGVVWAAGEPFPAGLAVDTVRDAKGQRSS